MSDTTELIKEKLDLVEFLRPYLSLSPAGKNFKGLCPFHKEKTPSFIVSPDRQIWHCFGCSAGGDVIGFLMRYENLEFFEALKVLAEKAGVDIRVTGGLDQKQFTIFYDINQAAKEFFKNYLNPSTGSGSIALKYLQSRGLKPETIQEFELGLSPNSSDALNRELLKLGYKIQDIEKAGLVFKTERGTYWDRFRNRIMFPLLNSFGKTIGFTGRVMPGSEGAEVGKYVNSPETPIFQKSRLLYGFDKSKNAIREAKTAVVVEGQMDLLMVWQDGVKNVIATSGTALTGEHLKNLKRLADALILAFDSDEAGKLASERVIDLGSAADFFVKIVRPVAGSKDPADVVKASPGVIAKLIAEAEPAMKYYFNRYLPVKSKTAMASAQDIFTLKNNIRMVLSKIKSIKSPIEQAYWVKELSSLTNVLEQHLFDEMNNLKVVQVSSPGEAMNKYETPENRNFSRRDLVAQRFIGLILVNPHFKEHALEQTTFLTEPYQLILKSFTGAGGVLPPALQAVADLISLRSGLEISDADTIQREFAELIKHLKFEHYRDKREAVGVKIKSAEERGDEKELGEALKEFDLISKEIYNI